MLQTILYIFKKLGEIMVNYVINHQYKGFCYITITDSIAIGCFDFDNLMDSEITEYISDCLTHEHIHRVLDKFFDCTTSKLFDGIEYLFRNDELHERHLKGTKRCTYQKYIEFKGYDGFLEHYGLHDYDVLNSNILCNTR